MREETKDRLYSCMILVIVLSVLGAGMFRVAPVFKRYCELKSQAKERDARIADTERKILDLGEMQRRFATDREFVESIARQNRRVYPGEVVFVFDEAK